MWVDASSVLRWAVADTFMPRKSKVSAVLPNLQPSGVKSSVQGEESWHPRHGSSSSTKPGSLARAAQGFRRGSRALLGHRRGVLAIRRPVDYALGSHGR